MNEAEYRQLLDGFPPHVRDSVSRLRESLAKNLPPRMEADLLIASWDMGNRIDEMEFTLESAIYLFEISRHFDLLILQSQGPAQRQRWDLSRELSGNQTTAESLPSFLYTTAMFDGGRVRSVEKQTKARIEAITPDSVYLQSVLRCAIGDWSVMLLSLWPKPEQSNRQRFAPLQQAQKFATEVQSLFSEDGLLLIGNLDQVELYSGSLAQLLDERGISSRDKDRGSYAPIALRDQPGRFGRMAAGMFDCSRILFRTRDADLYSPLIPPDWTYEQWRAFQLSPNPLHWTQVFAPGPVLPAPAPTIPDWPAELVDAMARGDAVLFAGAGVGAQAGLPVWRGYVEHLFEVARTNGIIDEELAAAMRDSLQNGQHNDVADSIALRAWPNPAMRQVILDDLRASFDTADRPPSPVHRLLASIAFRAVLTTNFDSLLHRAFEDRGPSLLPQETERIKELIAKKEPFRLHLYGRPEIEESLLLTSLQFSEFLDRNIAFGEALASLYVSSPFFFIGCSFEGTQAYLSSIRLSPSSVQHYALMDISGEPLWKTKADVLKLRYGITVVPYERGPDWSALAPVLESLVAAVKERGSVAEKKAEERPLKQVVLKNIGALEEAQIEFRSGWTILIGPNGVGKSTVLRAIATAFAGETATGLKSLLRFSATEGRIEIQTASQTAVVNIRSTGRHDPSAQIKVERSPERPLDFEPYPVIAFPPLRAFRDSGTTLPPQSRAVPEDVLPLADNTVDRRLSDLKFWLINLEHSVKDERHRRVRDYFFSAIERLAAGVPIAASHVDPDRSQVFVRTADGAVPIETVSQGSASLMCWIGVLLQRLTDIHTNSSEPWKEPALVLIDEIDTHMHPQWQRLVVYGLKQLFPRVQFIATTHSPLLVADLPPESIVVLRREEGRVICAQLDPALDLRGLRADQILLGEAFGVDAVRGPEIEQQQKRYVELSLKPDRGPAEEKELAELAAQLNLYHVTPEETRVAREAARLIEESLDARISDLKKEDLIDEIRAQMLEIKSAFRRKPMKSK